VFDIFGDNPRQKKDDMNSTDDFEGGVANILANHPFLKADYDESILAMAVNNYSICALFLRRVHVAVSSLESLILEDPPRHMIDATVFNLCTLYEIASAPELSTIKKRVLHKVATLFHINDPQLHWQSFRLS
jgi:hypothetical protein